MNIALTVLLWLSVIVGQVCLVMWIDERLSSFNKKLDQALKAKPKHTIERHIHIQHTENTK